MPAPLTATERQVGLLVIKRDLKMEVLKAVESKLRREEARIAPREDVLDRLEERAGDLEGQIMALDSEIEREARYLIETEVEGSAR